MKHDLDVPEDISFGDLGRFIRRNQHVYSAAMALGFLGVVAFGLARPRQYSAEASFVAQTRTVPGGLTQIAAQFGLGNLASSEASRSPAFYADLLQNDRLLREIVRDTLDAAREGTTAHTLKDVLKARGSNEREKTEDAMKRFREKLTVRLNAKTSVVSFTVTMPTAALAAEVANLILNEVDIFNLQSRRTQASAERRFAQQRVDELRTELRVAEDRLEQFLLRNRNFRTSPELTLLNDRLQRDLNLKQQVYATLSQAFEQARIEEVRDTPAITRVQNPEPPARPDRRGLLRLAIGGLLIGAVFATVIGIGRDSIPRFRNFNRAAAHG